MHDNPVRPVGFIVACIIAVLFQVGESITDQPVSSFVVFCDVGQGDASYIHIKPRLDIIIDTGKQSSVENCIHKHNRNFDGVIEAVFISHLQIDHYGGLESLRSRYTILSVYLNREPEIGKEAKALLHNLEVSGVPIREALIGDVFESGDLTITVYWPTSDFLHALKPGTDPNEMSQILHLKYHDWSILYTGDISAKTWIGLREKPKLASSILKVPHHGSKHGLNRDLLLLADPTYSVISVGRNNSYGHPSPEILELLKMSESEILRTDILGDIIFLLD